eukprot:TRINITY_DN4661_c0_g1_i1.p1 TRINITY_DN4661_c0_g1~~TRINITY_DN4661_c0_g1_i1.p1  ORF type:complete len:466 (+),score=102.62 TRINITY_DN4661_c0_g1_i1:47-1399(+)
MFMRSAFSRQLRMLTTQKSDHASAIQQSYLQYWDHIRFRKGWATPQFTSDSVKGLLQDAADHSAAIYEYLDSSNTEPRLRKRGGEAIAFLSGVSYDPIDHPDRFIRELVHSTVSDASGYVEGLTTSKIDELMNAQNKHRVIITQMQNLKSDLEWSSYKSKEKAMGLIDEAIKVLREEEETAALQINVTSHAKSVQDLVEATDIKWENVKQDPTSYSEELAKVQEKCQESTSNLMKDLLSLQQQTQTAVAEGVPADETVKSEIVKIHNLLETVDEVAKRISVLQTATESELERQEKTAKQKEEKEETETWLKTLATTMLNPDTWKPIGIKPEFSERNGPQFSLISTYLPSLSPDTCEVNVNGDVLSITGSCLPTKGEVEQIVEQLTQALRKNPSRSQTIFNRQQNDFARYLSKGKWGSFEKYYTLPAPLPSNAVRAQYADNVLSIAVPHLA